MQTIILIFGTFNPITKAHIQMGLIAKQLMPGSRIIYIPSKNAFLQSWKQMKDGAILNGDMRIALMKEALMPYDFEVDDIEICSDISGKTYDTIEAIKEKYGTDRIYICMGTDKVGELHSWYKGKELIEENRYIIISRDGNGLDSSEKTVADNIDHFTLIDNSNFNSVSSSQVRKAYTEGNLEAVRENLPENVYTYLTTHTEVYK